MRKWQSYIMHRLNATGHRIADNLQRKTNRYSSFRKRLYLFAFCGMFFGSSIYIVIHAFDHSVTKPLQIQAMTKPIAVPERMKVIPIAKQEYERIERYKQQILSLPKQRYDSLLLVRPHLLDSIRLFENLYQSQLK
jgi:hypothetical protein